MTNLKKSLDSNDAMRHMWYATWHQARLERYQAVSHDAILAHAWDTMGRDHTWRMIPRTYVLACLTAALQWPHAERVSACTDTTWYALRRMAQNNKLQPAKFRRTSLTAALPNSWLRVATH